MYYFSERSEQKLLTCHPKIQLVMREAIKIIDISIITGERGAIEQDYAYEHGYSKVPFPESMHNKKPSEAIDVMLWNKKKPHIRWNDYMQMAFVAGVIISIAQQKEIKLIWGGNWDNNLSTTEKFYDGAHFELAEEQ